MIGPGKKALFATILALMVVVAIELVIRGWFAFMMGPSLFWYGTSYHRLSIGGPVEQTPLIRSVFQRRLRGGKDEFHNVRQHEFVADNYTKYFPHESRSTYDADTGEVFHVTINERGFRGPETTEAKPPGTVRVVTLGASSTFGYHNADTTTYPVLLERLLNERCKDGPRYEVLNLGIPHLTSGQIASLFDHEALPLHPDVVTFYEGINDGTIDGEGGGTTDEGDESAGRRFKHWMREHFLLPYLLHEISSARKDQVPASQVDALSAERPPKFVENLERIRQTCAGKGILFLVGRQQARSLLVPREEIKGVTYADEVARVREKLERTGTVTKLESNFLVHDRIMDAEQRWAAEKSVPLVDILGALDHDRDVLVSWVHLSPRGNAMVADTYASAILERTCHASHAVAAGADEPAGAPPQ